MVFKAQIIVIYPDWRIKKNFLPMQPGDVPATSADTSELGKWVGFQPDTAVTEGVQHFVDWYLGYYGRNS